MPWPTTMSAVSAITQFSLETILMMFIFIISDLVTNHTKISALSLELTSKEFNILIIAIVLIFIRLCI
jgi:hypothetical protein